MVAQGQAAKFEARQLITAEEGASGNMTGQCKARHNSPKQGRTSQNKGKQRKVAVQRRTREGSEKKGRAGKLEKGQGKEHAQSMGGLRKVKQDRVAKSRAA